MKAARSMAQVSSIPRILSAARVLYDAGLLTETPDEVIRRFADANPEIKHLLALQKPSDSEVRRGV